MSAEASPGDAAASPGDAAASVLPEDQQQDGGGIQWSEDHPSWYRGWGSDREGGWDSNNVEAGIIEKGSAGTVAGAMETGTSRAGTETGRSAQHIAVLAKPGRTP